MFSSRANKSKRLEKKVVTSLESASAPRKRKRSKQTKREGNA